MKTFLKTLVVAACCVLCCSPFSIFAEEYSPEDVDWSIRPRGIVDNDFTWTYALTCEQFEIFNEWRQTVDISSSAGFYYTSIDCLYIFTSISNFEYGAVTGSGYTIDYNSDGTLKEIKSYSGTFYPSDSSVDAQWGEFTSAVFPGINDPDKVRLSQYLSHYNSSCTVSPTPTPTPTPTPPDIDSDNCEVRDISMNAPSSDVYGYIDGNYYNDSWVRPVDLIDSSAFYKVTVFMPTYEVRSSGNVTASSSFSGFELRSFVPFEQSSSSKSYLVQGGTNPVIYAYVYNSNTSFSTLINFRVMYTVCKLPDGVIDVNDVKGNDLIENGNSSSQSVSNSLVDSNSSLNDAVNQYDQAEKAFTDDFKVNVDAIDTNFSWGTQFLNSANFVRTTFNELVEPAPIYNMILFSLILGFALFIIGRLR